MIARRALAALAFAFLLTACGPAGKHPESVVQRRLEGEPRTLNPILATTDPENIVLSLVLRNLLEYDETLKLVPGLAESVTASADYRTFTVTLHPGLRWEDGSPVTAEDVATTIRILVDPKTPALSRKSYWDGFERVDVVGPERRASSSASRMPSGSGPSISRSFPRPTMPGRTSTRTRETGIRSRTALTGSRGGKRAGRSSWSGTRSTPESPPGRSASSFTSSRRTRRRSRPFSPASCTRCA